MGATELPGVGWYTDPTFKGLRERYWDGSAWTRYVSVMGTILDAPTPGIDRGDVPAHVRIECPSCQTTASVRNDAQVVVCAQCAARFIFVRCRECAWSAFMRSTKEGASARFQCRVCNHKNKMPFDRVAAFTWAADTSVATGRQRLLARFTVLGSHGLAIRQHSEWHLCISDSDVALAPILPGEAVVVPLSELVQWEIGGPGLVRTGGGFIGGGFGVEGAAVGMAVATALNSLTTKTRINTIVQFAMRDGGVVLHTSRNTPEALELACASVRQRLLARAANVSAETRGSDPHSPTSDTVSALTQLVALRERGELSDDEFKRLRQELLGSS